MTNSHYNDLGKSSSFWTILVLIAVVTFALMIIYGSFRSAFGQEILNTDVVRIENPDGSFTIHSKRNQFYLGDAGTYYRTNNAIYTRSERDALGYKFGVWTASHKLFLPDSFRSGFIRHRYLDKGYIEYKPVGFVLYNKTVDSLTSVYQFNNVPVSINGNEAVYTGIRNGVNYHIKHGIERVKQEIRVSPKARAALGIPAGWNPNTTFIFVLFQFDTDFKIRVLGTELDLFTTVTRIDSVVINFGDSNKDIFEFPFEYVWTDTDTVPLIKVGKKIGGNKYFGEGLRYSLFADTLNSPGTLVIDPTVILKGDAQVEDTYLYFSAPSTNYSALEYQSVTWARESPHQTTLLHRYKLPHIGATVNVTAAAESIYVYSASNAGLNVNNWSLIFARSTKNWEEATVTADSVKKGVGGSAWSTRGGYTDIQTSDSIRIPLTSYLYTTAAWSVLTGASYPKLLGITKLWLQDSTSNYGRIVYSDSAGILSTAGTAYYNSNLRSSEYTGGDAYRPSFTATYTVIPANVYAADSLAFSSLTDSTATLDSIAGNPLDISTTNAYAIYDTSMGVYLDTTQTAPFKKAKTTYVKSAWKNKLYPFPRDYVTRFIVQAFAQNGSDSLKTTPYEITIGTPSAGGDTVYVNTGTTTKGIIPKATHSGVVIKSQN